MRRHFLDRGTRRDECDLDPRSCRALATAAAINGLSRTAAEIRRYSRRIKS